MVSAAVLPSDNSLRVTPDEAVLVERTLARGFPLLSFPQPLEARFMAQSEARRFLLIVLAAIAGIVVFAGMAIADYWMSPDVLGLSIVLRWAAFPPMIVLGLCVLRRLRMPNVSEWFIVLAGIYAAALETMIVVSCKTPLGVARTVELNVIVVYACAISRFWPAVTLGGAAWAFHFYILSHVPDPTGVLGINMSLLLATSMGFVLYGNYRLEHDERLAFLLGAKEQSLNDELSDAHDRLTRMATTDALTNVANRRYFESFLAECWQRAQQQRRCVSLMIVDVDFFKPYNDFYGHQAGDKCLVAVAQALKRCLRRPNDLVARWGGEEFVIVMMDADVDAAAAAAERIRHTIASMNLPHAASQCARHVTVSGGRITVRPDAHTQPAHYIELADEALYRAKATGRNRICAGYEKLRASA